MKTRRYDNRGSVMAGVLIGTLSLLLVGAVVFAAWAFMGMRDYKNNVQQKIDVAVQANTKKVQADDAAAYAIEAQKPYTVYNGPSAYGSLSIPYPKTWSVYVRTSDSNQPIDLYAYPNVVPDINQQDSTYALRVQVLAQSYSMVLSSFDTAVKQGKVKIGAYALPKEPSIIGVHIQGQLTQNTQGEMIVLPLRDKTLKMWTESSQFYSTFEQSILPNASFAP